MSANNGYVIRTKMATAMINALQECVQAGRNPKRVGRRILTNQYAGVGVKFVGRAPIKNSSLSAESAVNNLMKKVA